MQSRTLTTSRRLARGRPGAAPAPGARRAPPRRCAAPSQEPSTSSSGRAPSLQSIQDGGSLDDGYQSPMLSLDWGEPAATAGGAPAAADALHLGERLGRGGAPGAAARPCARGPSPGGLRWFGAVRGYRSRSAATAPTRGPD